MDFASEQIDASQQTERARAFVLVVARERRINARHGRQVWRRRRNRLDARLLIVETTATAWRGFCVAAVLFRMATSR